MYYIEYCYTTTVYLPGSCKNLYSLCLHGSPNQITYVVLNKLIAVGWSAWSTIFCQKGKLAKIFPHQTFLQGTVYVQILKACKFQGHHKSSIFTILFSMITKYPALWLMQVKACQWNFVDENFVDGQLTAKTSKITSLKNLYVYGIMVAILQIF